MYEVKTDRVRHNTIALRYVLWLLPTWYVVGTIE